MCMIQGEKLSSCDSVRDDAIDDLANGVIRVAVLT
jgi:hypothetical protein